MILFCRSILWDLGVPQCVATVAYEDNEACWANAQKPTPRVQHMDITYNVLREWVEHDLIILERVDTKLNMAGHSTKKLGPLAFRHHTGYILGHVLLEYSACFQLLHGLLQKEKDQSKGKPMVPSVLVPSTAPSDVPTAVAAAKLFAPWQHIIQYYVARCY